MSKVNLIEGVILSNSQNGLLALDDIVLSTLIKEEPITNIYDVEHTPFARGKFATVRRCTHRATGIAYAAKFIRKRRRLMNQKEDILHEIAVLLMSCSSDRIVHLHEVYETNTEMALVLELASGGELQRLVELQDGLPEVQAIRVMKHILEALSFLHSQNIAHLDLKPQNILLSTEDPIADIKLCDFGISRVIQNGIEVREILGTPDYVAPEILNYEPISLATDIWSVGVLAYVLLSSYSPFAGDNKQQTYLNISQCDLSFPDELFEGVSQVARHFIQATLRIEPGLRLTVQQCLDHPWLKSETPLCATIKPANIDTTQSECDSNNESITPFTRDSVGRRSYQVASCQDDKHRHNNVEILGLHDRGILC